MVRATLSAFMIGLSLAAQAHIQRLEAAASRSVEFRRLLAETLDVPRRAGLLNGACVEYRPDTGRLVFDEAALKAASDEEATLEEAHELARAAGDDERAAARRAQRVMRELAAADARKPSKKLKHSPR